MGEPNRWLIAARRAAGHRSARAAAVRFHWNPSTYASHENGQTPLPPRAAQKYARAFRTSPAYLLTGEGDRHRAVAQLRGKVGAGAEIIPTDHELGEETDLPPGAPANTTAVVVDGDSMYPRYFSGEKLFYLDEHHAPTDLVGQECVVKLVDGRMLVKILRRGSRRNLFNLESWNAPMLEDQRVEWAAPVRWRG